MIKISIATAILALLLGTAIMPETLANNITQNNNNPPLTPELIAYWNFDEGTGSVVHDTSGNHYDGYINDCVWAAGMNGSGLAFPYEDSIVYSIPPSWDDYITNYISVEAWINWYGPNSNYPAEYIFDSRAYFGGVWLYITNDANKLNFCYYANSQTQPYITSIQSIPTNSWTHVKGVYDGTTQELRLYINDQLDNTMSINLPYSQSGNYPAIGNNLWAPGDGNWRPFNGVLDEMKIYGEQNFPPISQYTYTPHTPYSNTNVTFNASTSYDTDGTIVQYQWDWNGDGIYEETTANPVIIHAFPHKGNYGVTLQVTDDDGATNQLTQYLAVLNQPPLPPTIEGPSSGKPGIAYLYNFSATDPDNDHINFMIDWGDGNITGWIGPYNSGQILSESHAFAAKGTYAIKSKVVDTYGDESDWSTITVTMPLDLPHMSFWAQFFQRFPHAFPILRHLMGY